MKEESYANSNIIYVRDCAQNFQLLKQDRNDKSNRPHLPLEIQQPKYHNTSSAKGSVYCINKSYNRDEYYFSRLRACKVSVEQSVAMIPRRSTISSSSRKDIPSSKLFLHSTAKMIQQQQRSLWVVFLFIFITNTIHPFAQGENDGCRMEMWVFEKTEQCEGGVAPTAKGYIYADGKCRTVETTTPVGSDSYHLLPGSYSAVCTSEGKIRIDQSGCVRSDCSALTPGVAICERDFGYAAALFSRLSPPEFKLQDPADATVQGFYSCSRLIATSITVTFTVFGDCSTCTVDDIDEVSTPAITVLSSAPTADPTNLPTKDASTLTPVSDPTPNPTRKAAVLPAPKGDTAARPINEETISKPNKAVPNDVTESPTSLVTLVETKKPTTLAPTSPPKTQPIPDDPFSLTISVSEMDGLRGFCERLLSEKEPL